MSGNQLDGFSCTQQERRAALHIAKDLTRQIHRCISNGNRVLSNRRVGADFFGDTKRLGENEIQMKTNRTRLLRYGKSLLHLAKYLGLAQHHRVQSGSHPHQVRSRCNTVVTINRR